MKTIFITLIISLFCFNFTFAQKEGENQQLDTDFKLYLSETVQDDDLIYTEVDHVPVCSTLKTFYKGLRYPHEARSNGIEGKTIISFIVDENGSMFNAKIEKDIGHGCGEAALKAVKRIVDSEDKCSPAIHKGKAVKFLHSVNVHLTLL